MNWDAIGALAEIIGSLTVIVTLLYIGIQVRDAKRMNEIALRENRTTNIAARVIDNPHLSQILSKIRETTGQLPAIEAAKKEWGLSAQEAEIWFRYMGTIYRGLEAQFMSTGELGVAARRLSLDPQAELYFKNVHAIYDESFISALAEGGPQWFEELRVDT